ncbi:MAG: hypothetical protein VCF25_04575, partial [Candidatus Poribacteria bacterium]
YLIGFPFADSWFSHLFYRREPCLYFNIYNVLDKLISRFCGIVSEQCQFSPSFIPPLGESQVLFGWLRSEV